MAKRNPEAAPRMFTKAIGDYVQHNYEKKVAEEIYQHSLTLLEKISKKNWSFKSASLKNLTQNNKENENKNENIDFFISETLKQISMEYKILLTPKIINAVENDIKRSEILFKLAERKNISEYKRPLEFYNSIKGDSANIKLLNWFIKAYSTHIEVLVKFDNQYPQKKTSKVELFLNSINAELPVLYSRFASLVLEKSEMLNLASTKEI